MTQSILIAYPSTGHRIALDLVEHLDALGEIKLRSYARLGGETRRDQFCVAVCVVTDESSIDEAHALQNRLGDIPTLVIDNTRDHNVPVNGFAGCLVPRSDEIRQAVTKLLESPTVSRNGKGGRDTGPSAPPRQLASRFDVTLARFGGIPHSQKAVLFAATRHLAWELRSDNFQAAYVDDQGATQLLFPEPHGESTSISPNITRRLLRYGRPLVIEDLRSQLDRPLIEYLQSHDFDLITPLVSSGKLIGWIAFGTESEVLTDFFLDDLYVVSRLLTLSLAGAAQSDSAPTSPWSLALGALRSGMLIANGKGEILDVAGDMSSLGIGTTLPKTAKAIKNPRLRELMADARDGQFRTIIWRETAGTMKATSVSLDDGTFAINVGVCHEVTSLEAQSGMIPLGKVFEALPLPVIPDASCGIPRTGLPQGNISLQDLAAITKCAEAAHSKSAKALKIRFQERGTMCRAVLFFERPSNESAAEFQEDVDASVQFVIAPS